LNIQKINLLGPVAVSPQILRAVYKVKMDFVLSTAFYGIHHFC